MADKRKNTRAYTRANPNVPLYTDFHQGGRKNQGKKKADPNLIEKPRDNTSVYPSYQPVVGRESSLLSFELETMRFLGGIFSTLVQEDHIYHDNNVSLVGDTFHRLENNYRLGYGNVMKDRRTIPFVETNLIDLDDHVDLEENYVDPKEVHLEIEVVKKWL